MKISPNSSCLCKSSKKYKKCCKIYHDGILPDTALKLMRSRFSAFALKKVDYIISTTHNENSDFTEDLNTWRAEVLSFCENTKFINLSILESIEGEDESFVSFRASLEQDSVDSSFNEKSRFLKNNGKWFYVDGTFFK